MDERKEIRNSIGPVTVVTDENKRTVEGYASVFETASDGLSFEEVIEKGAFDGVLERSDVFALLNHDMSRGILARSLKGGGTLSLSVDEKGLKYRFEAPNTALGDELLEYLKRGEINQSSFAFDVKKDKWEKRSDGTWKRTIQQVGNLYDVSPVYCAAYSATSVYLRGMEEEEKRLEEANKIPDSYYEDLRMKLNI